MSLLLGKLVLVLDAVHVIKMADAMIFFFKVNAKLVKQKVQNARLSKLPG